MNLLHSIRGSLLKLLIPSRWVEYVNGKKTLLGLITLAFWVVLYALPALFPEYAFVAQYAQNILEFLVGSGVAIDQGLLTLGGGLTVIGLLDKLFDHWPSKLFTGALKLVEEGAVKLKAKGEKDSNEKV